MMFGQAHILRTKWQPPRSKRGTLRRQRLTAQLAQAHDYRLTLLIAPTGYGKSTLVTDWLNSAQLDYLWYNFGQADFDPQVFLLHLAHALNERWPGSGQATLQLLEQEWHGPNSPGERTELARQGLRLLINGLCEIASHTPALIVFDDFHLLPVPGPSLTLAQEFIADAPAWLHFLIASRQRPDFELLSRWQVQDEVLSLGKTALAFTPAETAALFEQRGYTLSQAEADRLATDTEGWVIALQMVRQNLQGEEAKPLDEILRDLPGNLSGLFDYLAHEILNRQPGEIQSFLLESAVLRRMTGPCCDSVLQLAPGTSASLLRQLGDNGLFVIAQGEEGERSYRYHHLFGEFLYTRLQLEPVRAAELHRRAARYFESRQPEESLHHWLAAHDWDEAARILKSGLGQAMLDSGQLERLAGSLHSFPPEYLLGQPVLALLQGDYQRLTSRFSAALQSYQAGLQKFTELSDRAGMAQALRRHALVYLDTVQPTAAEEWLEKALTLARADDDRLLQAAVLRDLAENKLNRGRPLEAAELHRQAARLLNLATDEDTPDVRILLRSGRLAEAAAWLERHERPGLRFNRPARSHREGLLVLSLIEAMRGAATSATERAEQGLKLARQLHTPFTEAVAWSRLGHARTISGDFAGAWEAYQNCQTLGDQLKIRRLRAELLMGLCLWHGCQPGGLAAARVAAQEGVGVARQAGDEWIEGYIELALTKALTQHQQLDEAAILAQTALSRLTECGDSFGAMVAQLWLVMAANDWPGLQEVQQVCQQAGYEFLLNGPTMFGPSSLPKSDATEPTAGLRVRTLGTFEVIRPDGTEIGPKDWQRDRARQLFQLLLIRHGQPMPKEQILDFLWPDSSHDQAEAGFKVTLNALVRALEPERSSRSQSSYILRAGSGAGLTYALNGAIEWDGGEFEPLATKGQEAEAGGECQTAVQFYEQALTLYRGDFLPAALYDEWAAPERDRLLSLWQATAERLARLKAAQNDWPGCQETCRLILSRDNCCEEAYRLLMTAQWKLHQRTAALRTYEMCATTLADELGVSPMPALTQLHQEILQA